MGALALTDENLRNQVSVVEEEIKVNVFNRPYGGFPWIPLPALAFDTYPNAHNGYGDFAHLEEATLNDAADFYERFYASSTRSWSSQATAPSVRSSSSQTGTSESSRRARHLLPGRSPSRTSPRTGGRSSRTRSFPSRLSRPAPGPTRSRGPRIRAYVVLANVLSDGDASRLRTRLIHHDRTVTDLACMIGVLGGDTFTMRDPVLFQVIVFHPGVASTDALLAVVDEELERLAGDGPTDDGSPACPRPGLEPLGLARPGDERRACALASAEVVHGRAGS